MTLDAQQPAQFCCTYDLIRARGHLDSRQPQSHQHRALQRLYDWYAQDLPPKAGGILVLPTGGGKTFTAQRFLARKPLSDGYKVLWLAHTHHLLEQAYESFRSSVAHIAEPRNEISVRVVSGTPGHLPSHTIKPSDDVIIGTLQTLAQADQDPHHNAWHAFLESCNGKLFVVFDEAHHSPAPTYRRFIQSLRQKCGQMRLLGLTATPYYSDETKAGWLRELFPQDILYQDTPARLVPGEKYEFSLKEAGYYLNDNGNNQVGVSVFSVKSLNPLKKQNPDARKDSSTSPPDASPDQPQARPRAATDE